VKPKRQQQAELYETVTKPQWLEEHPSCEICGTMYCVTVHHKKGRLGDLLNNTKFFMTICAKHHDSIHRNVKESYEKGWMLKRNSRT